MRSPTPLIRYRCKIKCHFGSLNLKCELKHSILFYSIQHSLIAVEGLTLHTESKKDRQKHDIFNSSIVVAYTPMLDDENHMKGTFCA